MEYLSSRAINQKNKGTLLSPTLKVGESKVPLFFSYLALELRHSVFLISNIFTLLRANVKKTKFVPFPQALSDKVPLLKSAYI